MLTKLLTKLLTSVFDIKDYEIAATFKVLRILKKAKKKGVVKTSLTILK